MRSTTLALALGAALAGAVCIAGTPDPEEVARLRRAALEAYRARDWPGFLANAKKAEALQPGRPGLLYNLGCAESLNGHLPEAARAVAAFLAKGLDFGVETDADLAALRASSSWASLKEKLERLRAPVSTSETAFTLSEKGLLTEGLAYDPVTRSFFVSSVRKRKIVRRGPDGTVADFVASGQDGLLGVLALRVDVTRRELWATTVALPQMEGFDTTLDGRTGVFGYDLATGKVLKRVFLAPDGKKHNLNDLTLDASGDVFLSDSAGGAIYRLRRGKDDLEVFVPAGVFRSPQGLAFSADGKRLYVADYGEGLTRIDVATGARREVTAPADVPLAGIDGLASFGDVLAATQNGIEPHRVVRLALDARGGRVVSARILERSTPSLHEPTLGVVVDGWFHYIADSQWELFGDDGATPPPERLREPLVLKTRL